MFYIISLYFGFDQLINFLFQLNVHIVFEGEKEFHQNVKLWGVSIMNPAEFFLNI